MNYRIFIISLACLASSVAVNAQGAIARLFEELFAGESSAVGSSIERSIAEKSLAESRSLWRQEGSVIIREASKWNEHAGLGDIGTGTEETHWWNHTDHKFNFGVSGWSQQDKETFYDLKSLGYMSFAEGLLEVEISKEVHEELNTALSKDVNGIYKKDFSKDFNGVDKRGFNKGSNKDFYKSFYDEALRSFEKKWESDPFFKKYGVYETIRRSAQVQKLQSEKYLSTSPASLDEDIVTTSIEERKAIFSENPLSHSNSAVAAPYSYAHVYLAHLESESVKKSLSDAYDGIFSLLQDLGEIDPSLQKGYFDTDYAIYWTLDNFRTEKGLGGKGISPSILEALKVERHDRLAIKELYQKATGKSLGKNAKWDKRSANAIAHWINYEKFLDEEYVSEEVKKRVARQYYISLAESQNYTAENTQAFISDFYRKETDPDLIGYYERDEVKTYLYKNKTFDNSGFFAVEKKNGIFQINDDLPAIINNYLTEIKSCIASRSSSDVVYAYTMPYHLSDQNFTVVAGDKEITIPAKDFVDYISHNGAVPEQLKTFVNSDAAPKEIIFFRDPFFQRFSGLTDTKHFIRDLYGKNTAALDPTKIMVRLQRDFPEKLRLFLASDFEIADQNHRKLITNYGSFVVGNPGARYKINDYQLTNVIATHLSEQQIVNTKRTGFTTYGGPYDVFITIGHKDAQFLKYYQHLIASELLRDKLPVNYSCYVLDEENWASSIIQTGGTRGIVYFKKKIRPEAVKKVILKYLARTAGERADQISVTDVLRSVIDECAADPANASMKEDIEALGEWLIYQLSFNDPSLFKVHRIYEDTGQANV